jgi:spermidine synthase
MLAAGMRVGDGIVAAAIVFVASFCTLVIELIAGRILAPWIGVSLYTWTSVIGVCLAGISAGNYVGGRIADRMASGLTLGVLFLASGVVSVGILPATEWVIDSQLGRGWPLMLRILADTAAVFFLPTFLLGTITPVVVKLSLADLRVTGSTVGRLYAVSTVGAIAGTFATGFFLIDVMGTRAIVWTVAAVLTASGLVIGRVWRVKAAAVATAFALACLGLAYAQRDAFAAPCVKESNYYCIQIIDQEVEGRPVRSLALDHLVHSYVALDDPTFIGYGYERVYQELTDFHVRGRAEFRALSIGAGGYTFPRYLAAAYRGARVDVVEIDPAVTAVARDRLGLPDDPRILTHNMDARLWFVEQRPEDRYDLVYGDAFNDIAIPYHLTTVEFDRMVRRSMKPDGILMANIIDDFDRGEFLRASIRTLMDVFEHVHLFALGPIWEVGGPGTYVVVASAAPVDVDAFLRFDGPRTEPVKSTAVMPLRDLRRYLRNGREILLTDDHAPVDNLIAPVFDVRAGRGQ